MRSFIAACSLFLLLAAVSIGNGLYIERFTASLLTPLEEIRQHALQQRWQECRQPLEELEQLWEERQLYLQVIVEHDEIERTEDLLASLQAFLSQQELPESLAELAQLQHQLQLLSDLQQLKLGYIL